MTTNGGIYESPPPRMNGGTKGPLAHEYEELNEAGRELLSFLSTNEATVCNI